MKQLLLFALIFGIIGLFAGYMFFGKIGNEYISISRFFQSGSSTSNSSDPLQRLTNTLKETVEGVRDSLSGLEHIRWNIILSGLLGVSIGINLSILTARRRR